MSRLTAMGCATGGLFLFLSGFWVGLFVGGVKCAEEVGVARKATRDSVMETMNPDRIPVAMRENGDGTYTWWYNPEPDYIKRRYCK